MTHANAYDYVIVGGGSSGCALAARLSENPAVTVLLIEAGGDGRGWTVRVPMGGVLQVPTHHNNWAFETVPQPGLNGRRGYVPRGRVLGGSSAINAMVYTRGHREDYDHWASLGNAGWSYDDLLPYFVRNECNERLGAPFHGQQGPLKVSDLRSDSPFHAAWMDAGRAMGLPLTDDFNGADQEGVGVYQVTQHQGERWSASRAYIEPLQGLRPNLQVITGAQVERVSFEQRRASGVVLRQGGTRQQIQARAEVVLSAGAIQSPQLLMLSGIGDAGQLQALGLPVLHHLPGVGANLQDHPDFVFGYRSQSLDTLGISARGGLRLLREIQRYRRERRGMVSSNFAECGAFLKTRPQLTSPNVQLHLVVALVEDHARKIGLGHGLSCHVCLLRPRSRGSLRLASAQVADAPLIDPAFLADPADLDELVEGFKLTRRLMQQASLARFWTEELWQAGARSDDEIRGLLRQRVDTIYHPAGSCKMGSDAMAVVDAQLRVRGIEGLRVADASIMPTVIAGNTNAPCMVIGEKAADLIRQQR